MNIYASGLAMAMAFLVSGCGVQAAESASGSDNAIERVVSTISVGHEISTSFAKEKAAAAPAEMYPSF